jgi:glycyl-tRNA synthetase
MTEAVDLMQKIVSLCKRRGFIFQSSEIYGGLKSCYDYGPLGVELKRNVANEWWRRMVYDRDDVVGMDASIMMHPKVWETSGHLSGFSDPLVDCRNCKERFRADKAPRKAAGEAIMYREGGKPDGKKLQGIAGTRGYVCPVCGCADLSDERQFNLMFRASYGPVDPLTDFIKDVEGKAHSASELRQKLEAAMRSTAVYLRPETAQAMFVQFLNVQQTTGMKIPFGIAQSGKSFRNEIITEHFVFRSCEFEQMEMEFFIEPGTQVEWLAYWTKERLNWYHSLAHAKDKFRLRQHAKDELAHYSDDCYDIEYLYPWGWGELEGIASRTDYDLTKHSAASGAKLSYFDQQKNDPQTGKPGWRYTPYVIEPAAGLTRSVLMFLLDAYAEEKGVDHEGQEKTRVLLKLHPRLAPVKAAILPLVKKDGQPEIAQNFSARLRKAGLNVACDVQQSIGKRYAKHDEIGTPFCITVDNDSVANGTVTLRYRDTSEQIRVSQDEAFNIIVHAVNGEGAL